MFSGRVSRRSVLGGLASVTLGAAAPEDGSLTVSVADFGAGPGVDDVGPGVKAAIARLSKRPRSTLHFPPGTYRFAARDGVAMLFDDMDNVTVEGEGATLLFNGVVSPLLMRRCRAPLVKGLTFDWQRPPFSQGEVTEVRADGRSVTLRIDPDFPVDGTETIKQLGTYDRRTRAMTWHGVDDGGSVSGVSLISSQLLRLTLRRAVPFKAGDTVVARHGGGPAVVELDGCERFSIQDVLIHAGPAIGIAVGGCGDGSIQGVRVEQKPGSSRLMSTDADALHCASCSGDLRITDCTFSGMGDDGINVTGLYQAVETTRDSRSLSLTGGRYAPPPMWAAPQTGDRMLLVSGLTLIPLGEVQVETLDRRDGMKWSIGLTADHPAMPGEPVFAIDLQRRTRTLVSHCNFLGNRARGVLAHGDTVIERCRFEHQSDSAILLAPDMFWQEGPAVERTAVRDNFVHAGNLLERVRGAVWIGAFVSPDGTQGTPTPAIVNESVVVEGNHFVKPNGPAVAAAATRDLRIEGNQIEQASAVAFSLENVRDVKVWGNRCDPVASVQVDRADSKEVVLSGNVGLRAT